MLVPLDTLCMGTLGGHRGSNLGGMGSVWTPYGGHWGLLCWAPKSLVYYLRLQTKVTRWAKVLLMPD